MSGPTHRAPAHGSRQRPAAGPAARRASDPGVGGRGARPGGGRAAGHGDDDAGGQADELQGVVPAAARRAAAGAAEGPRRRCCSPWSACCSRSSGPKILGDATNVIFAGVVGQQIGQAGLTTVQQADRRGLERGRPGQPGRHAREHARRRRRPGHRLHAARPDPGRWPRSSTSSARCSPGARRTSWPASPSAPSTGSASGSTRSSGRLPLAYFDRESRGDILSPRHQRHRQHQPDAPAEPDPAHHVAADRHRRPDHDVHDQPAAGGDLAARRPGVDRRHRDAHRAPLAEAVRGPVGEDRRRSTATSRRCTPGTPS